MTTVIKSKNPTANPKFFNFLNKESMIDCTLVADGHMMNAHKIVLAASSTYFEVNNQFSMNFCLFKNTAGSRDL